MSGTPTRGRPPLSPAESAARRDLIAAAAAQLFDREGFAGVSIRRVAQAAGCAPMTVYAHFGDKAGLLAAIWTGLLDAAFAEVERAVRNADDDRARLAAACQAYVDYWVVHPEHYRSVFMMPGVSQTDVGAFLGSGGLESRLSLFRDALRSVRPALVDPALTVRLDGLFCGLQGIAHNLVTISGRPWTTASILVAGVLEAALGGEA